jgi:hypothetical protein
MAFIRRLKTALDIVTETNAMIQEGARTRNADSALDVLHRE